MRSASRSTSVSRSCRAPSIDGPQARPRTPTHEDEIHITLSSDGPIGTLNLPSAAPAEVRGPSSSANQQLTGALEAARTASAQEKALREKVEGLLEQERQRSKTLEKQRTKMATELP